MGEMEMFEFNGGIMRHNLMQPVGFRYKEKSHSDYYTFFHFFDSVELNVSDNIFITTSHAVIIVDKGAVFESNSLISYPMHYSWFRFDCDKSDLDALGVEFDYTLLDLNGDTVRWIYFRDPVACPGVYYLLKYIESNSGERYLYTFDRTRCVHLGENFSDFLDYVED